MLVATTGGNGASRVVSHSAWVARSGTITGMHQRQHQIGLRRVEQGTGCLGSGRKTIDDLGEWKGLSHS
jgi:hypothetical protein